MRRLLLILVLSAPIASAATFNVINLNDSGAGSLRQAVLDANTTAGADTITFQPGLNGQIVLTSGEISITEGLTISGPGPGVLSVGGNDASRIFNIAAPPATPESIVINDLGVTNGLGFVSGNVDASSGGAIRVTGESLVLDNVHVANSFAGGNGGGLAFSGLAGFTMGSQTTATLTIRNSEFAGNFSFQSPTFQQGKGGGLYVRNAPLTIENTIFNQNSGPEGGGGLWAETMDATTPLRIVGSRFTNNTSGGGPFGTFIGGGIGLSGVSDATIEDTEVISNNSATGDGAGIAVTASSQLALRRSTVASNQVQGSGSGGGILVEQASFLALENSTIAGNFAGSGGGVAVVQATAGIDHTTISGNFANGLLVAAPTVGVIVTNSILSDSLGTNGDFQANFAQDLSIGHSLIEGAFSPFTDLGGNIIGQDPQLGGLANNGGPTSTMLPANTSPVINAADPAFVPPPSTDQRGVGFPRVIGGRLDMGAVEVNLPLADLVIAKVLVGQAQQDQNATFNITVTNNGPDAAQNVVVSDTLSPQLTLVSATPSQGSCSGTTTITCSLGTLATNATATIVLVVTVTDSGPITNTATVTTTTPDPASANNSSSAFFTAQAAIAGIPTLDPTMLFLLAASLAIAAMLAVRYR